MMYLLILSALVTNFSGIGKVSLHYPSTWHRKTSCVKYKNARNMHKYASILKLDGTNKKNSYERRKYVGRLKKLILGNVSKIYEKKDSGSKGLNSTFVCGKNHDIFAYICSGM